MPQHEILQESDDETRQNNNNNALSNYPNAPSDDPNPSQSNFQTTQTSSFSGALPHNLPQSRIPEENQKRAPWVNTLFWVIITLLFWTIIFDGEKLHPNLNQKPTDWSQICESSKFRNHPFLSEFFDYCEPDREKAIRQFVFVKKHKCASTSIQYLLHKVAQKHKSVIARPVAASFIGGYPGKFDDRFIASRLKTGKFDSMLYHMRFDRKSVESVVHEKAVYISSVRNITSHYESLYHYYYSRFKNADKLENKPCNWACLGEPLMTWMHHKTAKSFKSFIDKVDLGVDSGGYYNSSTPWSFRFHNLQAFEFGLENDWHSSKSVEMEAQIQKLNSELDLVMIVEEYNKSLLMLKKLLRLDWIDLYGPAKGDQNYEKEELGDQEKEGIHNWNYYDDKIYKHFHSRFMKSELQSLGPAVDSLELKLERLYQYCAKNKNDCKGMRDESVLVAHLKHYEQEEWNEENLLFTEESVDYKALVEYMEENNGNCSYGAIVEAKKNPHEKPKSCLEKADHRRKILQEELEKEDVEDGEMEKENDDFNDLKSDDYDY